MKWPRNHTTHVAARLLFGEHECRYNGCGRDATVVVARAAVQLGGPPEYVPTFVHVRIAECPKHAAETIARARGRCGRRVKEALK
jgi:hypothetical protein